MELRCAGGALINMSKTIIGISGWRYAPWRGVFYPKGLTQDQELAFASRQFGGIELNGSFYSLQRPEYYARWYAQTPPGFVFTVTRSEARRAGKEGVSTCRSRWSPDH